MSLGLGFPDVAELRRDGTGAQGQPAEAGAALAGTEHASSARVGGMVVAITAYAWCSCILEVVNLVKNCMAAGSLIMNALPRSRCGRWVPTLGVTCLQTDGPCTEARF